jgi:hypothetical protein
MDLREQLEREIGDGPPLPPPETRLRAGRRALRRRRALVVVAAAGAAALIGAGAPLVLAQGGPTRGPAPVDTPTVEREEWDRWAENGGFGFDLGGHLRFSRDAVVHERRDGVLPGPRASTALDLTFDGSRTWHVIRHGRNGTWFDMPVVAGHEPDLYRDFDDYVAKVVFSLEQSGSDGPGHLRLETVGGMPSLDGAGTSIGPVVQDGQRAFGFEVESGGEARFVLLRPLAADEWRVERLEAASSATDLASWLRNLGWLPTGEEAS